MIACWVLKTSNFTCGPYDCWFYVRSRAWCFTFHVTTFLMDKVKVDEMNSNCSWTIPYREKDEWEMGSLLLTSVSAGHWLWWFLFFLDFFFFNVIVWFVDFVLLFCVCESKNKQACTLSYWTDQDWAWQFNFYFFCDVVLDLSTLWLIH